MLTRRNGHERTEHEHARAKLSPLPGPRLPKVLAAAGLVALIWSIHRFGRLGPEEPIVFSEPEPEAPRKKKKKKKRAESDASPTDEPPAQS